jgi:5'-nucleotidase
MEATLMGVPALAVSLDDDGNHPENYVVAADYARRISEHVLKEGLPPDTFLNVNVPPDSQGAVKGISLTRQGKRVYSDIVERKIDPRGKDYYWIGCGELGFENRPGTDFHAVARSYVSVTPLHLDLTNYESFNRLQQWGYQPLDDGNGEA